MTKRRRRFDSLFKAKVALESLKSGASIAELSEEHSLHRNLIRSWKAQLLENAPLLFSPENSDENAEQKKSTSATTRKLARLEEENEFLKKKTRSLSHKERKKLIELDHPDLSVRKQCRFLEVNRSSILYKPRQMSDLNEQLVELVMEIFEHAPYLGYRRVTELIREEHGLIINHKRVRRIMSELGLHSIKPRQISGGSKWITRKYSDLVEGIALDHPNQVWTSDITHIRLKGGWIYVVAIRDCYSKKILSWEHSYRIEPMFYVQALNKALTHYGSPEIFHAYEESLCTTELFLGNLEKKRIKISIDQNKKVKGSVLIEKFWRSIKDSRIEAKEESSENSLLKIVEDWVAFYNQSRPESMNHSHTPEEVYRGDQIHDGILRKKGICESSPWHLIPDGEEDQLPENLRDLEPVYSRYSLEKFEKTRG